MNKLNALSGQGFAQPEIGQSANCRELKFHDQTVIRMTMVTGKFGLLRSRPLSCLAMPMLNQLLIYTTAMLMSSPPACRRSLLQ